eukprot:1757844-Amphidinium_carterae.1
MAMVREQHSSCHLCFVERHTTRSYMRALKSELRAHFSHSVALQVLRLADGEPKLNTTAALKANLPDLVGTALSNAQPRR